MSRAYLNTPDACDAIVLEKVLVGTPNLITGDLAKSVVYIKNAF